MFSESDCRDRINKVIASMNEANLDALVLLDDDRRIGGGNIRYLINYYYLTIMSIALVITKQDVTLCLIPGLGGQFAVAKQQCPWVNILGTRQGLWGSSLGKDIKTALEKSNTHGKIGIDGLGIMPESLSKSIRQELTGFEITENTGIVEHIRMTKSPREFEAIREAARLADIGANTFIDSLKKGDPQYISMTKAENASKLKGAENVIVFMGVGAPWIWGQYPSQRKYQEGDMIAFEFNARFQGYYGQVNRTCVIGKPNNEHKKAYQLAFDSYKAIEAAIKPGITCSELYKIGAKVLEQTGYGKPPRQGHGMGLTIAEGYEIDEKDFTVLQPNFYIMVHTLVNNLERGIGASVGNALRVTETSHEILGNAKFKLQI